MKSNILFFLLKHWTEYIAYCCLLFLTIVYLSLSEETSFEFNSTDIGMLCTSIVLAVIYFFTKVRIN